MSSLHSQIASQDSRFSSLSDPFLKSSISGFNMHENLLCRKQHPQYFGIMLVHFAVFAFQETREAARSLQVGLYRKNRDRLSFHITLKILFMNGLHLFACMLLTKLVSLIHHWLLNNIKNPNT